MEKENGTLAGVKTALKSFTRLSLCASLAVVVGCASSVLQSSDDAQMIPPPPKISDIFFAQHHVLSPDDPLFKLVGDLGALIKVQVYSDYPFPSPLVVAILELDSRTIELPLGGPKRLPRKPSCDPVLMEHSYDDSFTAMIPKAWVRTGLKVSVELRDYNYIGMGVDDRDYNNSVAANRITVTDRRVIDDLKIGAPTKLKMTMFDIHYFGKGKGADHPEGWARELEAKLPVAELKVQRVRGLMFNEIVMPPSNGKSSWRYGSPEEFKERMGVGYDGEQGIALRWTRALRQAAGRSPWLKVHYTNICGVHAGGQGGGFRGVGSIHRHGIIIHELGHAFGLPHWARVKQYPYKRTMYGKIQGYACGPNAGPRWAFDVGRRDFIPPRKMVNGILVWKKDPMQGGGWSREKNYMYNHFSDYSINRMQRRIEQRATFWNEKLQNYARWNQETGAYDKVVENDGTRFPVERDVEVISLLVTANAAVPEANIIYDPIGPYEAGLARVFDADSAKSRAEAQKFGYTAEKCNVCLKVTQGGKVRTYLLPIKVSVDDDPLKAFTVSAINLPARDGEVTRVELLHAPDVITKGITSSTKVLSTWKR